MHNRFTGIMESKNTLFGKGSRGDVSSSFVDSDLLVLNGPHKSC